MQKVAVIGAGRSAKKFLENFPQEHFVLFTSNGGDMLNGQQSKRLDTFNQNDFDIIYIPIYRLQDVINHVDFSSLKSKIYWFDSLQAKLYPVLDAYGDSLTHDVSVKKDTGLTVIYDFRSEPLTFDFTVYLANCEMERRKRHLDHINLIFVPGDFDGFNRRWESETQEDKHYRLYNLIYAATQLTQCKINIHQCETRTGARSIWNEASNRFPEQHNFLAPDDTPPEERHRYTAIVNRINNGEDHWVFTHINSNYQHQIDTWFSCNGIEATRTVTLTLRENERSEKRNSRLQEWFAFADILNSKGYNVVFVRDTSKVFQTLGYKGRHWICHEASINLMIRHGLYKSTYANIFITNGVCSLTLFDPNVRYLMVAIHNEAYASCSATVLRRMGFGEEQIFGAKPWQKISWHEDSVSNLVENFNSLEGIINENF